MTSAFVKVSLATCCLLWLPVAALAEETLRLKVDGAVTHPLTLSAEDLAALPQSDVAITYLTGHGPESATYSGVALWTILEKAGLDAINKDKATRAAHVLWLTASDGYRVAIALGELDPLLEGKPALVALKRDGQPIAANDMFRIALPGDKHGARNMHALIHVEVQ
jgi:hypothetical protein